MNAFWGVRAHAAATAAFIAQDIAQTATATPPPVLAPPEEPRDWIVVLTFENGRRDPSSASLMTLADAQAEAESWRRRKPDAFTQGRVTASVHRIGEPL